MDPRDKTTCPEEHRLDAFLARTLSSDERAVLEAHFDACADCRQLVFALAEPEAATSDERHIGRYVIAQQLGEGAMGVVFAARDPALQRDVAIKVLRRSGADPEATARMRREAHGLARLAHPNVVSIFDVGTHGDDVYLAMELIHGRPLDRWLVARPRSWQTILGVLVQAARGLAAAHASGMVHRDIKPGNVMVTFDERVKLVDFGLAHGTGDVDLGRADNVDELAVRVTATGAFVGTPAYSAPEVLAGAPADRRSDVFSFCVMMFEALYGRHPFAASSLAELRGALARPVELPRSPRLPRVLRRAIVRGLSRERSARPPAIGALVPAMRAALRPSRAIAACAIAVLALGVGSAALVVQGSELDAVCDAMAAPPELDYDAGAIRAAFAQLGGAAIADRAIARVEAWRAAAGALAGRACTASRIDGVESTELFDLRVACVARSTERVAALVHRLASPTPALVEGVLDAVAVAGDLSPCGAPREVLAPRTIEPALRAPQAAMDVRLAAVEALDATGRHADASRQARELAAEAATTGLRDAEAEAWELVGQAHAGAQQPVPAREAYHHALIAAEAIGDGRRRAEIYLRLVDVDRDLERREDAAQWAAQARGLFDHLGESSQRWQLLWAEASVAADRDPKRAVALLREAIALHDRFASGDDIRSVDLVRALGAAQVAAGEFADGKRTLERALSLGESVLGPRHPQLIGTLTALGAVSGGVAMPAEALPHLERAFAIAEATAGREHAQLPRTALVLGAVYGQLMRTHDALAIFDRTVAAYQHAYGAASPSFADVLAARAEMLALEAYDGEPSRFASLMERALADKLAALAIHRASLSPDSTALAVSLERLGRVQRFADRPADAIRSFEEALAIRARNPKPRASDVFEATLGLGGALVEAKRAREALSHLEAALAIAEDQGLLGSDTDVADAKTTLGGALVELGRDRERARALLRDARKVYVSVDEPHDVAEVDRMLKRLN